MKQGKIEKLKQNFHSKVVATMVNNTSCGKNIIRENKL
jgi:hypothetical protein